MEATAARLTKKQRKALAKTVTTANTVGMIVRCGDGTKRQYQNADVPRVWPHRSTDEPIAPMAAGACTRCGGAYSELMVINQPEPGQVWQRRQDVCRECYLEDMAIRAEHLARQLHTDAKDVDEDYIAKPYAPDEVRERMGYRDPPLEAGYGVAVSRQTGEMVS